MWAIKLYAPVRLISITFFQSSKEDLKIKLSLSIAALFTTISILLNLLSIISIDFIISISTETSFVIAKVSILYLLLISSAILSAILLSSLLPLIL